ncbi:MAG: hypothetical protein J5930_12665, partial [Treponema sp.]|nr:hypothetical protein [Treponema sp.]
LAFKMRQWDAGKKQGGTLQGGFLDFFRSWDPLTHFELFAFCFMLKPCVFWTFWRYAWPQRRILKKNGLSANILLDLIEFVGKM